MSFDLPINFDTTQGVRNLIDSIPEKSILPAKISPNGDEGDILTVRNGVSEWEGGTYVPTSGGTMTGNLGMGSNKITGLAAATANGDAVRYEQAILQSLLTTRGDIIRRGASATERLALGATGKVLASDGTDATYRDLSLYMKRLAFQAHGFKFGSTGTGTTYILGSDSSTTVASPLSSATTLYTVPTFRLVGADYTVTGKTTKLSLDCSILINGTAPGVNVTIALLPVSTVGGAANAMTMTYLSAVASTVFTTPATNGHYAAVTTIDLPGDALYVATMAFSGNQAANSMVAATARVYISWT